jgi:hypothetical protein
MKKMIKKYTQFIKENIENPSKQNLMDLRLKFRETLDELADLNPDINAPHGGGIGGTYFSNMCKWEDVDLEKDFKKLQDVVDKHGFPLETIKELFSKSANDICGQTFKDFIENRNFIEYEYREPIDEKNGNTDYYLYRIAKEVGSDYAPKLGGDAWALGRDQFDDEEFMIRFAYGYHHTKYGQLYIEQTLPEGKTLEQEVKEWDLMGYQKLGEWFEGKEYNSEKWKEPLILNGDDEYYQFVKTLKFDDYVLIERDRIIIWGKELAEDLEPFNTKTKITLDYLYSAYVKIFDDFKSVDLVNTGDEIMVRVKDFKLDATM